MISSRVPLVVVISALILAATTAAIIVLVLLGNSVSAPAGGELSASGTATHTVSLSSVADSVDVAGSTNGSVSRSAASTCPHLSASAALPTALD